MSPSGVRLVDVGERGLIQEILSPRYKDAGAWRYGDDSAVVLRLNTASDGMVLASTDPAPRPVAWDLGFPDYFYWGWLVAAINWSDIAAAGASPLGLLTSWTLPNDMLVTDFERLLDGVDDCNRLVGASVIGGNIKEDPHLVCEATAFGLVESGEPLSRQGTSADEVLVSIGDMGMFWSSVLSLKRRIQLPASHREDLMRALLRPTPLVKIGQLLRRRGLLTTCTDSSDGVYGALVGLMQSNRGLGFLIDPAGIAYPRLVDSTARDLSIDPIRLALGFGDMQLIGTVKPEHLRELESLCLSEGAHCTPLGVVTGRSEVDMLVDGRVSRMNNFDNERFSAASQFTGGIAAYEKRLLEQSLSIAGSQTDVCVSSRVRGQSMTCAVQPGVPS